MNLLQALAESPVIQRFGWTLLHSSWQALAVAMGLALILPGIRKRGARAAYAACLGALLLMIVLPAITFFVVPVETTPIRTAPAASGPANVGSVSSPGPVSSAGIVVISSPLLTTDGPPVVDPPLALDRVTSETSIPKRVYVARDDSQRMFRTVPAAPLKIATPAVAAAPLPTIGQRFTSWWREIPEKMSACAPWLVALWAFGVLALSLWNLGGWFAVHRLKSRDAKPVSAAIQEAAARLSQQLGLSRVVRLLQSALVDSPVVIGALKPVVLLPASLITELPADQLESLVAHELAHVLRHDYLVNLLQTAIETLLFYHPAIWWISAKVREERENCCDDLTIAVTRDRAIYLRALAAVAGARASTLAPAASGGVLVPRLRRILGAVDSQTVHPARWLTGAVILSLCGAALAIWAVDTRTARAQVETAAAAAKSTPNKKQDNSKPVAAATGGAKRPQAIDNPEFPTKGSMRIHVVDEAGRPVPLAGVLVSTWTAADYKRPTRRYTCDDQGFVKADLPKSLSILRLWAKKKGYCEEFHDFETNSRVHELSIPDDFTFHMVRGITLTGLVKNAEGQPVQGAKIECSYDRSGLPILNPTLTDAQGRWRFENIRRGERIEVWVAHDDYISHDLRGITENRKKLTTPTQSASAPDFVLQRGIRPVVKVIDPSGKPVKGAVVAQGNNLWFTSSKGIRTDQNGLCRLPSLPTGKVPITVVAQGWMPDSRKVEIVSNMPPVNFELRSGKRLRLRFVDPSGAPVPKVRIAVEQWRSVQHLNELEIPDKADQKGVFEWSWAPDDPMTVKIRRQGFGEVSQTVTADDNEHVVTVNPLLHITGTVRDATTGREIDGFLAIPLLYFRPEDPFLSRNKAQKQKSGMLAMQFDRSDVGHGIQVEAAGYQTFRTNKPYHLGDPDPKLDIRVQPGERFVGHVLDTEGRPVPKATIGVASTLEQLDPAGLAEVESDSAIGFRVVSDDKGRFEIPSYGDRYALIVVSPDGFAEVDREANQIPGEIRLRRWAKLAGRLVQSGKPVPNREIFLFPIRIRGEGAPLNQVRWTATTGDDGSFTFERVPPVPCSVEAWLHWGAPSPLKSSRSMPLLLAPGEKREITLGGPGIDVIGQLVAENQPPGFDYHFALNSLVARRPGIQPPAGLAGKGFDWKKGWSDSWFNSPEGRAYRNTLHTWFVKPEPDGRFHISGVEPGDYDFAVNLYGTTEGCLVHPIAQRVVHFSVKPGDTKLDLGKVSIPSFTLPKVGDLASDFAFESPSGSKTSLAALRGNYVLIDFWATWCDPCVAKLDQIEHLREQFKGDKPLVVVGANLDADRQRARDFLKAKALPWQHALLGDWSSTEVPRRFAISTVPAYVLIGPDGRILAHEFSLEAVESKLKDLNPNQHAALNRGS